MAYPVRAVLEKERNQVLRLTEQEAERLNKGEVIQKAVEVNGEKTQQYLQLDPETKSVIHRRVTDASWNRNSKTWRKSMTSNWACSRSSRYARENPLN